MKLIRTLCLAFSMYSRIPMPILEYTQEDMRYTFLAFPLVGVVIAALEYGWFLICVRTGIGTSLYAALAAESLYVLRGDSIWMDIWIRRMR